MTLRSLSPGVSGLDLVLGGGLRCVARTRDSTPVTSVLIRGGPGTGKTVLAAQLARSFAVQLGGHVAYACAEILPTEVRALLAGVLSSADDAPLVVRIATQEKAPAPSGTGTFVVGSIETPGGNAPPAGLADQLAQFVRYSRDAVGELRVLVFDAVSEGYALGPQTPRAVVDGLYKFALDQQLILVVIEEGSEEAPSNWAYAADVVLRLATDAAAPGMSQRRLFADKCRFGPCDAGPHEFDIVEGRGIMVYPRAEAYRRAWAKELQPWKNSPPQSTRWQGVWHLPISDPQRKRMFGGFGRAPVVYVVGSDPGLVRRFVDYMLSANVSDDLSHDISRPKGAAGGPTLDKALVVNFGEERLPDENQALVRVMRFDAKSPRVSVAWLLAMLRFEIVRERETAALPAALVIGDIGALADDDADQRRPGVAACADFAQRIGVPVIVYETSRDPTAASGWLAMRSSLVVQLRDASVGDDRPTISVWEMTTGNHTVLEQAPIARGRMQ